MKAEHQYLLEIRLWPAAGQRERLFPGPRHFCPQAPAYGPGHNHKQIIFVLKQNNPFKCNLKQQKTKHYSYPLTNKNNYKGIQLHNYKPNIVTQYKAITFIFKQNNDFYCKTI